MSRASGGIRARVTRDLAELSGILVAVHQRDGYPVEGVADPQAWLQVSGMLGAWVAERGGRLFGHVALVEPRLDDHAATLWRQLSDERPAVLCRLFVAPSARGKGLGVRLTRVATQWAEHLGRRAVLDVLLKDSAAIRTYENLGWRSLGEHVHPCGNGRSERARAFVAPAPIG